TTCRARCASGGASTSRPVAASWRWRSGRSRAGGRSVAPGETVAGLVGEDELARVSAGEADLGQDDVADVIDAAVGHDARGIAGQDGADVELAHGAFVAGDASGHRRGG